MKTLSTTLKVLTCTVFVLALASLANAQATRTWVSGVGDDVNPCSRTAPCKTYAGAISKTAKDGEISTLDPGGFGAVTITKSITINGTHGQGYGSILAALTTGVIINITDVNDVRKTVRLRTLDINGASTGIDGIRINSALKVYVEDTVIDGFTNRGINDIRNNANGHLYVSDSKVRNTVQSGIVVLPTAPGNIIAMINNTTVQGSSSNSGIAFDGNVKGTVNHSFVTGHTASGFFANGAAEMTIESSVSSHNGTGIQANSPAIVRLFSSTVTNNTTSIPAASQAQVRSTNPATNKITGNTTNNLPTGPAVTLN
ncbi:MAG TPA: hypothetical protein VF544_18755 [Pyrinomonadaceae bacterium]|jgi:hypothetical protein